MSDYAITTYYNELENAIHYGGTTKETAIRSAFQKLLEKYAEIKDLKLIAPHGTPKDNIRNDWPIGKVNTSAMTYFTLLSERMDMAHSKIRMNC